QRISDAHDRALILILSDICMPGMSGPELSRKAEAARPDVSLPANPAKTGCRRMTFPWIDTDWTLTLTDPGLYLSPYECSVHTLSLGGSPVMYGCLPELPPFIIKRLGVCS